MGCQVIISMGCNSPGAVNFVNHLNTMASEMESKYVVITLLITELLNIFYILLRILFHGFKQP